MELLQTAAIGALLSWASGIRLYAVVFIVGALGRLQVITLSGELGLLAHPLVLAVAFVMLVVEFFADKVPALDSVWDLAHTFVRVPAGALLAASALGVDTDPAIQIAAAVAGGTLAGTSHLAKASTRALINTSPEPVTNWAASLGEEVLVAVAVWLAVVHPVLFFVVLAVMIAGSVWIIATLWHLVRRLFTRRSVQPASAM